MSDPHPATAESHEEQTTAGIYIHVPFCLTKCPYCDFYSVTNLDPVEDFLRALGVEMRLRREELSEMEVGTIYFGGGTPSLLQGDRVAEIIEQLHHHYRISADPEITLETNPGDLTSETIDRLVASGVNRFSIGAQTFDPELLKLLGRRHTAEQTETLVKRLRDRGVTNLSLDLIFGIPGSTTATLEYDLETLIRLCPTHISAYHLIYEEGTPLYHRRETGRLSEVTEEESLRQSHRVAERLTEVGYEHYEISAFALPGYRSRHNSSYWHGTPYIGLGPSAHSYIHPVRSYNPPSVRRYCRNLLAAEPHLDRTEERLTPRMTFEEYILTRLRTCEGLSVSELESRFGAAAEVLRKAEPYLDSGDLLIEGDRLHLSRRGIDLSDRIILDLI